MNRKVFLARVLGVLGARLHSVSIARKGIGEAMVIEEWSCAMDLLVILRTDAAQRGDSKAHKLYHTQFEYCQKLHETEQNAEVCVERLHIAFAKSGGEKPSHADEAEEGARIVGGLSKQYPSFKLSFIGLRLRVLASQLRMDYAETISICDEAFALLKRYPIFSNHARNAEYSLMGLISAVQSHNDTIITRYVALCEEHLDTGKDNWFVFKELQFLHLMRSATFEDGFNIVQEVLHNPRSNIQTQAVQDKWALFRLYAEFATNARVPVTRPADFNVLVPSLTGDKAGLNPGMIVLHVLLLAKRGQFGELRDRIEFIRGYRKRHLKGTQNSQANRFFKMLELIETCDLDYNKLVRKSRTLLEELKQSEENEPIQGEQVLAYSWIWNRLMEYLREYHPLHSRAG